MRSAEYSWSWEKIPAPHPSNRFSLSDPITGRSIRPTVVLVHHFAGNRLSISRYIQLLHGLGLDVVWFPLQYNSIEHFILPAASSDGLIGFGAVWKNQVAQVLKAIEGPKILFTLSMPSISASLALQEHLERTGDSNPGPNREVLAWICDGGPFFDLFECVENLFRYQYKASRLRAKVATAMALYGYGYGFMNRVAKSLSRLPTGYQVLSLRGGRDPLVPARCIDNFFRLAPQLNVERQLFADGGHLDGLKIHEIEYREAVTGFLNQVMLSHRNLK